MLIFDVPDRNAIGEQGALEAEAAADQEGDHVVFPESGDVLNFLLELAVAVDAVARKVGADVGAGCSTPWIEAPHVGDVQKWTGFGVALAEQQKIVGEITPYDHQVGLRIAVGQACCGAAQLALAYSLAQLDRGQVAVACRVHV